MNKEDKIKMNVYESFISGMPYKEKYICEELIKLLKEIAEFRTTNKIEDNDKVIVLLPEKNIISNAIMRGGSNE